jgi:hypothetical protein
LVAHSLGTALNINGQMMLLTPGSALGSDAKMVRAKVEALDIGETALTLLQQTFLGIRLGLKAIGIKFNVVSLDLDVLCGLAKCRHWQVLFPTPQSHG